MATSKQNQCQRDTNDLEFLNTRENFKVMDQVVKTKKVV